MSDQHANEQDNDQPIAKTRRPYAAPHLVRWGKLNEITESTGHSGAKDGAKKGSNRTSH